MHFFLMYLISYARFVFLTRIHDCEFNNDINMTGDTNLTRKLYTVKVGKDIVMVNISRDSKHFFYTIIIFKCAYTIQYAYNVYRVCKTL